MAIPSSSGVQTGVSAGEPTTVGPPITRCTSRCPISSPISVRDSMEARHRSMNVLLLTQENCGFCTQAKEILARLSVEYGFSVSTLDVGLPEGQALALHSGVLFPPGIFIDDELFSYGRPSERKLRRELERRLEAEEASAHSFLEN